MGFPSSYDLLAVPDSNARSLYLDGGTGSPGTHGLAAGDLYFIYAAQPNASITAVSLDGDPLTQLAYNESATMTHGIWGLKAARSYAPDTLLSIAADWSPGLSSPALGYSGRGVHPSNGIPVGLADCEAAIARSSVPDGSTSVTANTGASNPCYWVSMGGGDALDGAEGGPTNGIRGGSPAGGNWDIAWGYQNTTTGDQSATYVLNSASGGRLGVGIVTVPIGDGINPGAATQQVFAAHVAFRT